MHSIACAEFMFLALACSCFELPAALNRMLFAAISIAHEEYTLGGCLVIGHLDFALTPISDLHGA